MKQEMKEKREIIKGILKALLEKELSCQDNNEKTLPAEPEKSIEHQISIGDRVKLVFVEPYWLVGKHNPVWEKTKIAGTVTNYSEEKHMYLVNWDNGWRNMYQRNHLAHLEDEDIASAIWEHREFTCNQGSFILAADPEGDGRLVSLDRKLCSNYFYKNNGDDSDLISDMKTGFSIDFSTIRFNINKS